jgi:hypothetical protein
MKAALSSDRIRQDSDRINPFLSFVERERYFSRNDFRSLRRRLPFAHWDRQRALNFGMSCDPAVGANLDARKSELEALNIQCDLWRCPDLFLWIERLLTATTNAEFSEAGAHLDFLAGGEFPPATARRMLRGRGAVYGNTQAGWSELRPSPVRRFATGQVVYYPESGLFDDLFASSNIDPGRPGSPNSVDRSRLDGYMSVAIRLIQSYSFDLAEDFADAIPAIALLAPGAGFDSGNFGLKYYGAIFFSPYTHNECSGAAALIHEYIHICNWLLWHFIEPEGRPPDGALIRSPITGNEVDAFSLCDAMMIYASNCDFFAWTVTSSDIPSRLKDWAVMRYRMLVRQMPALYQSLAALVPEGTRYRRYIEHAMHCFETTLRLYGGL